MRRSRADRRVRVTIAAQACLLLLHRETDYYPTLTSILVYPSGYTAHESRAIGGGIREEGHDERRGHTQEDLGALVLAWDSVKVGAADPADGENLVLSRRILGGGPLSGAGKAKRPGSALIGERDQGRNSEQVVAGEVVARAA